MKTEVIAMTSDEKKLIFNAIRYYQMFKVTYSGKEYDLCHSILTRLYDEVYTQKKEQPT